MKILVTGGAGFIGSNFVRLVLRDKSGHEVVNLDALTYAGNLENLRDIEDHGRYKFIKGDIRDRELMAGLFKEEGIEAVVNFAAESHVDRSIESPAEFLDTNVLGAASLLDAARAKKVRVFVQVSTDEVYGSLGPEGVFTEDTTLKPNSPYAASKTAADVLARSYFKTYGMPVIVTRSSNNYGPWQFPERSYPSSSPTPWTTSPCRSTATGSSGATGYMSRTTAGASSKRWRKASPAGSITSAATPRWPTSTWPG